MLHNVTYALFKQWLNLYVFAVNVWLVVWKQLCGWCGLTDPWFMDVIIPSVISLILLSENPLFTSRRFSFFYSFLKLFISSKSGR